MGLNGVVSGYPTSTNLSWVGGFSMDPWDLGHHIYSNLGNERQKMGHDVSACKFKAATLQLN